MRCAAWWMSTAYSCIIYLLYFHIILFLCLRPPFSTTLYKQASAIITHRFPTVSNKHTPLQNGLQPFILILRCDVGAFVFRPTLVKHAYICVSCLHAGVQQNMSKLFFSFLPLQERNHILAPSQWQLVGMHIVIKQFPVCKCPVYTFLLQSLSLDRLLEYEESSHTMKNENSRTSIKNPLCLLSAEDVLETDVRGKHDHTRSLAHKHTHTHTNYRKIKDAIAACWQKRQQRSSSHLIRENNREWTNEVSDNCARKQGELQVRWVSKAGRENREGQRDGGLLRARGSCTRQNGLGPLCDAFGITTGSTWLCVSNREDDGMFWKRRSTPAELIHSLRFTTAILRRLNTSLFTLRGCAFPTWCNHTNQHFSFSNTLQPWLLDASTPCSLAG